MKNKGRKLSLKRLWRQIWQVIFYYTLKPIFAIYFFLFHNLHFKRNGWKIPKGPVLFISNHHSNFDGFYLNIMFYWRIIHFVVNEELFITKTTSFVSGFLLGEIKRGVTSTDVGFIREVKQYVQDGRSIGLFPEGDIHFFGETLPLETSLAKLAKLLRIPVVSLQVHGAHLRAPRCGNLAHRGKIVYEITDVIQAEEVRSLAVDQLFDRMVKGIQVHENNYQHKVMTKMIGGKRAEWMELGLFLCPQCHQFETFRSKGNRFKCQHCGVEVFVNSYGFFEQKNSISSSKAYTIFDDCSQWNDWQLGELKNHLNQIEGDDIIFVANEMMLQQTSIGQYFPLKYTTVTAELHPNYVRIKSQNQATLLDIPLVELTDYLVQYKDVLELVYQSSRYRISTKKRKWSAYLWQQAIHHLITRNQQEKTL